jgi:tripeptidyl-peptidase-1
MTAEEVIDFFAPHEDSVNAVINWLVDAGIARERIGHSVNKQWIQFDAKVDEVEDLLYAEYHVWEHAASESTDVSCEEYHVPSHVQEHIDYVTPGIRMRSSPKKRQPVEMDEQAGDLTSLSRRESRNDGPKMMTNYGPTVPHLNSTNCDEFVRTECMRGELTRQGLVLVKADPFL